MAGSSWIPNDGAILSAYYGLDMLPETANLLCGGTDVEGEDGMPLVFAAKINQDTLAPEAFAVETATGERVTPVCATVAPAIEALELRSVLLVGMFGAPDAQPRAVEVVGPLEDVDGVSLLGERIEQITSLESGPSLVVAETFAPDTEGLEGECPEGTTQVVQLTWQGGVTGPDGAPLGEPQRLGVTVELESGERVTPIALADDDPDNYVHACLDVAGIPVSVTVAGGLFHDPGDDANPPTQIEVVAGVP